MSIGTKIIASTMTEYDEIIIKLESEKYQFFTHPVKDNKRFKLMLFGLPKVDLKTLVDEFKYNFNIEVTNIKEIQTSRSSADDALYMLEFNRDQISKREVIKIKYVYDVVIIGEILIDDPEDQHSAQNVQCMAMAPQIAIEVQHA